MFKVIEKERTWTNCTRLHVASHKGDVRKIKECLRAGDQIDAANADGESALGLAVFYGHLNAVKALLEAGASTSIGVNEGLWPLSSAAQSGRTDIGAALISANADINALCIRPLHANALMLAVQQRKAKFVKLLIDAGCDLSIRQAEGATALGFAAVIGGMDIAIMLLDAGADVNQPSLHGCAVLAAAAEKGYRDIVLLLLKRGAMVDQADPTGATALHRAVGGGFDEVVDVLIRAGADVNQRTKVNSSTSLHMAAERDHHKCAWLLLRGGALVSATVENRTPLHIAARWGHNETIEVLLSAGAYNNAVDSDEHTPLTYATMEGRVDTIDLMIDAGSDPNWQNAFGFTALFAAKEVKAVQALLSRGASVDIISKDGGSVLHFAAGCGYSGGVLCALYKAGANPLLLNNRGDTPAECARRAGKDDAAKLLDMLAAKYREAKANEEEKGGSSGGNA